jgi:hypothetical protein
MKIIINTETGHRINTKVYYSEEELQTDFTLYNNGHHQIVTISEQFEILNKIDNDEQSSN